MPCFSETVTLASGRQVVRHSAPGVPMTLTSVRTTNGRVVRLDGYHFNRSRFALGAGTACTGNARNSRVAREQFPGELVDPVGSLAVAARNLREHFSGIYNIRRGMQFVGEQHVQTVFGFDERGFAGAFLYDGGLAPWSRLQAALRRSAHFALAHGMDDETANRIIARVKRDEHDYDVREEAEYLRARLADAAERPYAFYCGEVDAAARKYDYLTRFAF